MLFYFLFTLLLGSCSSANSPTLPASDKQSDIPGLPPSPGIGNLAGTIVGTLMEQALSGLLVGVGSKSTLSDADGNFLLEGVGDGSMLVTISGENVYQRGALIDTADGRSVLLDAIETQSAFNLDFYRELVRGQHPSEGDLFPVQRWTGQTPPTIYIDTNASATDGGFIDPAMSSRIGEVIRRMIPVLSGDVYASAPVQFRSFSTYSFDSIPENSIVISFDDTLYRQGALGVTFTEPSFTAQATTSLRKAWIFLLHNEQYYVEGGIGYEELAAHELGHGFGYRHTSLLPSVMEKYGADGELFSDADRLHMRVMYKRPFGNLDIDTDALPNTRLRSIHTSTHMFIECGPSIAYSVNVSAKLQQTEGPVSAFLSHCPSCIVVD